jgi:uncharacterized protein (TIRG00374 family)
MGLGLAISLLTLYLALRKISLNEIVEVLIRVNPRYTFLGFISVVLTTVFKAIRWKGLMGHQGKMVSLGKSLDALITGQLLNYVYPLRLGDISRAQAIGPLGPGRVYILGTVAIEKIFDLGIYCLLFITLLVAVPQPGWLNGSGYALVASLGIVLLAIFILMSYREQLTDFLYKIRLSRIVDNLFRRIEPAKSYNLRTMIESGYSSLDMMSNRRGILVIVGWSIAIWGLAVYTNQLILLALNLHLPLTASLLILVALQAGISLPSAPGRVGLFEYICILALGFFGIDRVSALGFGILLHVIVLAPIFLAGFFLLVKSWKF